jgi:exonuclease SbcC
VDQQASLMNKQNTWVNCENQLPALEQQINDYTLQLQSIDSELKNSKSRAGAINLINEFNRASDLNTQFIAANLALSNTPQITNTNLTDVETIQNDLNIKKSNLDALNNAQKYIIQVEALQTNNLVVTKENLPDENIQLLPNSPIDIDCSGTVKLSTNSVKIKIKPSVEKILQLENDIKNFELKLKEIFISYKVDSMDALRALNNNYNTAMQVKSSRNTELQAVLNGRSLEALKAEVDSINNLPLTRGVEELTDLKNSITTQLNQSKIAVNKHKLELENLKKQYQGVIDIVQAIATKINEISAKQAQIDGLAAIPDGINFDTLNTTFETRKERYNTNSVSLTDKLTQKQILEGNPINYTTEEKEQEINDKTRQKESLIQEAISLKSALDKLKNILLNAQNAPYINYHNKLNTYLNTLSGGKYVFHSEQKLAPNMVVNVAENKELPFQLLSQGTSGIMGLAVRLSMADYLLENNDGFLVFDDPMVDFDEGRQQNAVSCFEDYAENKQVLIFTCHNSHASQFTRGNIINI